MVVDGKAKTKGKERRVFLFEKIIIFSEPMTREGGLPEFRYMHNMKVNVFCYSRESRVNMEQYISNLRYKSEHS